MSPVCSCFDFSPFSACGLYKNRWLAGYGPRVTVCQPRVKIRPLEPHCLALLGHPQHMAQPLWASDFSSEKGGGDDNASGLGHGAAASGFWRRLLAVLQRVKLYDPATPFQSTDPREMQTDVHTDTCSQQSYS